MDRVIDKGLVTRGVSCIIKTAASFSFRSQVLSSPQLLPTMAPNPPTAAEREEVRDGFITCYKKLAALKDVLVALGPGGERHKCSSAFFAGLVRRDLSYA